MSEPATRAVLLGFVVFYLPHLIFFLYIIGQSLFSATTRFFLYSSVCHDQFDDHQFQLVNHDTGGSGTQFSWSLLEPASGSNNTNGHKAILPHHKTGNVTIVTATCGNLSGPADVFIQMEATNYMLALNILQSVPAFLLGLSCGGWVDRIGQKLPLMICCVSGALVAILFIILQVTGCDAVPGILFGVAFNSLTGRHSLVTTAIQTYVTDQTANSERSKQLGLILAMNFLGLCIGTLLLGVMGDLTPFWAIFLTVTLFFGIALFGVFFLRGNYNRERRISESSDDDEDDHHHRNVADNATKTVAMPNSDEKVLEENVHSDDNDSGAIQDAFWACFRFDNLTSTMSTVFKKRPNHGRPYLLLVLLCIFLQNMCNSSAVEVLLLFVVRSPLSMSPSGYGFLLSFEYAIAAVLLLVALPLLVGVAHLADVTIVNIFTIIKCAGFFLLAFSNETWMVYLSVGLVSTLGVILSSLRSIASKIVDENETGRCFSVISSVDVLSDVIGTIVFTQLYYVGLQYSAVPIGLPYIVAGCIHIFLFVISLVIQFSFADFHLKNQSKKINAHTHSKKLADSSNQTRPTVDSKQVVDTQSVKSSGSSWKVAGYGSSNSTGASRPNVLPQHLANQSDSEFGDAFLESSPYYNTSASTSFDFRSKKSSLGVDLDGPELFDPNDAAPFPRASLTASNQGDITIPHDLLRGSVKHLYQTVATPDFSSTEGTLDDHDHDFDDEHYLYDEAPLSRQVEIPEPESILLREEALDGASGGARSAPIRMNSRTVPFGSDSTLDGISADQGTPTSPHSAYLMQRAQTPTPNPTPTASTSDLNRTESLDDIRPNRPSSNKNK